MLCGSHIKIWNLSNKKHQNARFIDEKLKTKNLFLLFFTRFARFKILIREPQSIWHKLLLLSWLYHNLKLMFCDQTCFMSKDLSVILYEQIKSKEKRLGKLFLRATETRFLDEISIENLSEGALPNFFPYSVPIQHIRNEYQTATWMSYLSF